MNNMPLTTMELKQLKKSDFIDIDLNALNVKLKNDIELTEHENDYIEWLLYLKEQNKQIPVLDLKAQIQREYDAIMKEKEKKGNPESPENYEKSREIDIDIDKELDRMMGALNER